MHIVAASESLHPAASARAVRPLAAGEPIVVLGLEYEPSAGARFAFMFIGSQRERRLKEAVCASARSAQNHRTMNSSISGRHAAWSNALCVGAAGNTELRTQCQAVIANPRSHAQVPSLANPSLKRTCLRHAA